jgi:hypothetical protein
MKYTVQLPSDASAGSHTCQTVTIAILMASLAQHNTMQLAVQALLVEKYGAESNAECASS